MRRCPARRPVPRVSTAEHHRASVALPDGWGRTTVTSHVSSARPSSARATEVSRSGRPAPPRPRPHARGTAESGSRDPPDDAGTSLCRRSTPHQPTGGAVPHAARDDGRTAGVVGRTNATLQVPLRHIAGVARVDGAAVVLHDVAGGFPGGDVYLQQYDRLLRPAAGKTYTDARPLVDIIVNIAVALASGDPRLGHRLQMQALHGPSEAICESAVVALAEGWPTPRTYNWLGERALIDTREDIRHAAITALVANWPDEETRRLLAERAATDRDAFVRRTAVEALAQHWPDHDTRALLTDRAAADTDEYVREGALEALAEHWRDHDTHMLLAGRATTDRHEDVRAAALKVLAEHWPDQHARAPRPERMGTDG